MYGSTTQSVGSPPRIGSSRTGDAEAVSMKIQRWGGVRILPWTGAALLVACLVGSPDTAKARTFKPVGPPYPEGDPTADDQPSPTPKPSRVSNAIQQRTGAGITGLNAIGTARVIWLSYVRVWIQFTLR